MQIVDRRLNPSGRQLANRQRFMRRAKALIRKAVSDKGGSVKSLGSPQDVDLPRQGMHEPSFRRDGETGTRNNVYPGNKHYIEGDTISRPEDGGDFSGSEGPQDEEGEDEIRFALSRDEFIDLYLEDLELPELAKEALKNADKVSWVRAGYSVSGSPTNLALMRTVRNSLSRRIALKRPKAEEIERLKADIAALDPQNEEDLSKKRGLDEELARLTRKQGLIPYLDPLDVRYRRFDAVPKPVAQAVMFCLMDVSGSMTHHMKDLAKRFYSLLYIFLQRKYKNVDVVFIRHTHLAGEVDEDTFFHGEQTGGTVVSTALEEMQRVVKERYDPDVWNIYVAQASDGDNTASDNAKTADLLTEKILKMVQYYAYVEVGRSMEYFGGLHRRDSDLWQTYAQLVKSGAPIAMQRVSHRRDIYSVFRELFQKKNPVAAFEEPLAERRPGAAFGALVP